MLVSEDGPVELVDKLLQHGARVDLQSRVFHLLVNLPTQISHNPLNFSLITIPAYSKHYAMAGKVGAIAPFCTYTKLIRRL